MEDNDEKEIECVERQEISRKLQRITEKMDEQRREQEKGEKNGNIIRMVEEASHEQKAHGRVIGVLEV